MIHKLSRFLMTFVALFAMTTGAWADGWQVSAVGEGEFVLYNVGANQYFTKGNSWATQASITTDGSVESALNPYCKCVLSTLLNNP